MIQSVLLATVVMLTLVETPRAQTFGPWTRDRAGRQSQAKPSSGATSSSD